MLLNGLLLSGLLLAVITAGRHIAAQGDKELVDGGQLFRGTDIERDRTRVEAGA
jgi:hypothetical protein